MKDVRELISRFGTAREAADAIGAPVATVFGWRSRNSIPHEWALAISRAAYSRGIADVTLDTLAELAERRRLLGGQSIDEAA